MAKAKWKEPPLQRAFGQRTEELHIKTLKSNITALEYKLAIAKAQKEVADLAHENIRKRLQQYESANMRYKWLKAQGVVLEYDGEFKHLKDDDMDKFFEDHQHPDYLGSIYAQMLANSMQQTKNAVAQTVVYGTFNEKQDPTKWP